MTKVVCCDKCSQETQTFAYDAGDDLCPSCATRRLDGLRETIAVQTTEIAALRAKGAALEAKIARMEKAGDCLTSWLLFKVPEAFAHDEEDAERTQARLVVEWSEAKDGLSQVDEGAHRRDP